MKKTYILKSFIIFINLIVAIRLFDVMIIKHEDYSKQEEEITNKMIYSSSAPRGRILDKSGNILVDNKGIKVLVYKNNGDNKLELCKYLAEVLDINNYTIDDLSLKEYYYVLNKKKIDALLDKKMVDKYNSKIISKSDFNDYKYSFINNTDIDSINPLEAYIYKLMGDGYSYQEKIIKSNITEEELNKINELNSNSLGIVMKWVRVFNYDTCLNDLFGAIGPIAKEKLDDYLDKGYSLDDTVGVSFLESYYEDYLKGEKAQYRLKEDGSKELIQEEKRGNDLVLSIDINTQLQVESALKEVVREAKMYPSSKYYHGSFVVVSNPQNGSIEAVAGYDYTDQFISTVVGVLTNSYAVGSVVKGASQSVAFMNGVINPNKRIQDSCVKIANMPAKCSWARLGSLNDIDALTYSSNYYQFISAIKVSGREYTYNMRFNPSREVFDKYRSVFKSYGLGDYSGIDLQEEKLGITGERVSGDLLLNYVIGQYDTYSPLMLTSYINTIANSGMRQKLRLVDYGIDENNKRINLNESEVLSVVDIKSDDLLRIQTGLRNVMIKGTGASYANQSIKAAGKTGTSETFYEGISTTTRSFIMYAPIDNPKYSLVIVSPNLSYKNNVNNYSYPVNSRLSRKISNILFEKTP